MTSGTKWAMYDEGAISAEFRELAALADKEYREFVRAPGAGRDGDEILAHSCVYGYLYDRYFLETQELLLNELRWLQRTRRPIAPGHAVSAETFDRVRDALLDELIDRFAEGAGGASG